MENNRAHYVIELQERGDERGGLAVVEECNHFPYAIKRVFYEYNTLNDVVRGNHANRESRFGLISIVGSCIVEVDDGYEKTEYFLNSPLKMLFVDKMMWKTMKDFSVDNVLLVLSDQIYNANEYIREYDEFASLIHL